MVCAFHVLKRHVFSFSRGTETPVYRHCVTSIVHPRTAGINPVLQSRLWQEKSVSFPYFEDLLLPWEGYLSGTEFITEYHERAANYLRHNPQYQTEGGRCHVRRSSYVNPRGLSGVW